MTSLTCRRLSERVWISKVRGVNCTNSLLSRCLPNTIYVMCIICIIIRISHNAIRQLLMESLLFTPRQEFIMHESSPEVKLGKSMCFTVMIYYPQVMHRARQHISR